MRVIQGKKSRDRYFYDEEKMTVTDKEGNCIKLYESLDEISDNNLRIYLDDLFHKFYTISNEFTAICRWDKTQDNKIEWEEFR